jgi:hypothetical protein
MTEWQDEDEVVTTFGSLKQGMREAGEDARAWIIVRLEKHYDLTRFFQQVEGAEPNPDWDAGYQAALAIIKELPK